MLSMSLNSTTYSLIDKLKAVDYFLIIIVAIIGSLSVFSIYSTESGNFSFYTKNHLIRFLVFFSMFLILSFIRVSVWYRQAYFFYIRGLFLHQYSKIHLAYIYCQELQPEHTLQSHIFLFEVNLWGQILYLD